MFLYHTLMEVQSETDWRERESRCRTWAMHHKPSRNACMLYHESCADQLDSWNSKMHTGTITVLPRNVEAGVRPADSTLSTAYPKATHRTATEEMGGLKVALPFSISKSRI